MIPFIIALVIHACAFGLILYRTPAIDHLPLKTIDLSNFQGIVKNRPAKKPSRIVELKNAQNLIGPSDKAFKANQEISSGEGSNNVESQSKNQNNDFFINYVEPDYPSIARKLGNEGTIKIKVFYDQQGFILKIDLIKSSGSKLLDDSVLKAANKWRLNQNTNGSFEKTFIFKLNN